VPLAISIDQLPEAWVIGASGDLDYSECASFRVEVDRILREMPAAVIADFSQVEYLDSSGLGLLLSLAREYADKGGRLVLVTDETVDGVLEMTRLQGVFTIEEDVHSALAHLRTTEPPAGGGSV
jgi:anti-sigma B factor antagonist